MPSPNASSFDSLLAPLVDPPTHDAVERALRAAGWTFAGAGDWAIALRSPDGAAAARISPFDPTGPYTAALYREVAPTGQVPELYVHRRLAGGGDLQIMEWLDSVPEEVAKLSSERSPNTIRPSPPSPMRSAGFIAELRKSCLGADHSTTTPSNVMAAGDGHLVLTDPFYADGPNLYATAATNPDLVVASIPADERRYMSQIPLSSSGDGSQAPRQGSKLLSMPRSRGSLLHTQPTS